MLNVMYATNANQISTLEYSLISLLKHNKNVHIFLCTNSDEYQGSNPFSEKQINKLKAIVKYMDSDSFLEQVEIKDIYNEALLGCPYDINRYTRNSLTRLLADKIFLPRGIKQIYYFDPDNMFTGDIRPLFVKCLNLAPFSIRRDSTGTDVSGTLIMNLEELSKQNFFKDSIDILLKNDNLKYPDQDAIQYSLRKNGIETYRFMPYEVFLDNILLKRDEPLIYHFAAGIPYPVGIVSEEEFVMLFPQFSYVKDLLENFNSIVGQHF